jgi:type IV pilus assembly protein PilA
LRRKVVIPDVFTGKGREWIAGGSVQPPPVHLFNPLDVSPQPQTRRHYMKTRKQSQGFSLLELLIVVAIILIIAAISVPSLLASRRSSMQAAAVGDLKTLSSGMSTYISEFPAAENTGTSTTWAMAGLLTDLTGTCSATAVATPTNSCLIDATLASGTKDGYTFTMVAAGPTSWSVTAVPAAGNLYGNQKSFFTDQTGIVRYAVTTAPATVASSILGN